MYWQHNYVYGVFPADKQIRVIKFAANSTIPYALGTE